MVSGFSVQVSGQREVSVFKVQGYSILDFGLLISDLWFRSPRRRRYDPYEPEAGLEAEPEAIIPIFHWLI